MIDEHIAKLDDTDEATRRAAADALSALAKANQSIAIAIPRLLDLVLHDTSDAVRNAASTAVGWSAHHGWLDPSRLALFVALLGDRAPMIRHDAAWVLESFAKHHAVANPGAIEPLLANLAHENADTRAAAIYCLGAHVAAGAAPDPDAVRLAISAHAGDAEQNCRDAVAKVLASSADA